MVSSPFFRRTSWPAAFSGLPCAAVGARALQQADPSAPAAWTQVGVPCGRVEKCVLEMRNAGKTNEPAQQNNESFRIAC